MVGGKMSQENLIILGGQIAIVSAIATSLLNHWLTIILENEKERIFYLNSIFMEVEQYVLDFSNAILKMTAFVANSPQLPKEGLLQELLNQLSNKNKFYSLKAFDDEYLLKQIDVLFGLLAKLSVGYTAIPVLTPTQGKEFMDSLDKVMTQLGNIILRLHILRKNRYRKPFFLIRFWYWLIKRKINHLMEY
jgi:hypothetical protein